MVAKESVRASESSLTEGLGKLTVSETLRSRSGSSLEMPQITAREERQWQKSTELF
jgi:hypothetical protein